MADVRRCSSNRPSDLEQILQEAQHRWLRPLEICEILRNHQKFYLTPAPPVRPSGGSVFLFDRKVLRYFRKDGHNWRKKKDGKTVKEAHEKLKVGSIDALHCYYAHGEDNENFQRRIYWMLEEQLERFVLVHYREVKEVVGDLSAAPDRSVGGLVNDEAGELKKLDSFGRWMDKEIGGDYNNSLMASDSRNYWNTLDTTNEGKEVSSLSHHMHLDTDSLGPYLSQEQLYSISDFAPDWACSGVETKVLITGSFLGERKLSDGHKWCFMFGDIEVPAEVLSDNVIRCRVPFHTPGRVSFYMTCSNRLACSEVMEFEYWENSSGRALPLATESRPEEVRVQIRLAKMLCLGLERKWLDCSAAACDKCKVKTKICALIDGNETQGRNSEETIAVIEANYVNFRDALTQSCLKDKLYEWLVCKTHEGGEGMQILDGEGQGIIHLTAALGYEWALGPITAAGISINFRDRLGRTALDWASYHGREEARITLIRLGAAVGAVDDPKSLKEHFGKN